jgi:hypothetical protein
MNPFTLTEHQPGARITCMSLYLGNVSVFRARQSHMDRGSCRVTEYSATLYYTARGSEPGCWEIVSVRVQVISDEKQLPVTSPDASLYRRHKSLALFLCLQSLYQQICKESSPYSSTRTNYCHRTTSSNASHSAQMMRMRYSQGLVEVERHGESVAHASQPWPAVRTLRLRENDMENFVADGSGEWHVSSCGCCQGFSI